MSLMVLSAGEKEKTQQLRLDQDAAGNSVCIRLQPVAAGEHKQVQHEPVELLLQERKQSMHLNSLDDTNAVLRTCDPVWGGVNP
jgi:hypothetical protein